MTHRSNCPIKSYECPDCVAEAYEAMAKEEPILDIIERTPTRDYALGYQHGVLDGAQATEDRIIKLLENQYDNKGDDGVCIYTRHMPDCCNCDLIALIKGEQE